MLIRAAALGAMVLMLASPAVAKKKAPMAVKGQMILYSQPNYDGEDYLIDQAQTTVELQFNIGSIALGPDTRFEVCFKTRFRPPCLTLSESVPASKEIGIEGGISSAHQVP